MPKLQSPKQLAQIKIQKFIFLIKNLIYASSPLPSLMVKNAPLYDKPSRALALEKLTDFIPKAGLTYRNKRNYDFGPSNHNYVSKLSPFIRRRILTEAEVLKAILNKYSLSSSEKFVQEVFWRTYWKGWLEMRPSVWLDYQTI